jgi:SAM-dependent methyltransferase
LPGELTREHVSLAYRMLLGREPESETVISAAMDAHPDLASLGRSFVGSPEFRLRHGWSPEPPEQTVATPSPELPMDAPPLEIETEASPELLARMIRHLGDYWAKIGRDAPHWSVLTAERFRPRQIDAHLDDFHASGEGNLRVLEAILARAGRRPEEFAHCVDYGCGVGRITQHLARRFRDVTGLDISRPHLDLAEATLRAAGHGHVVFRQVTGEALMPVISCDLWFSVIVLQHDPPPIAMEVLARAFDNLSPGGLAVFQIPVWLAGYRFRVREYLAGWPGRRMEMHCVPQGAVLELARRKGLVLLELREDNGVLGMPGRAISNNFVFEKRGFLEERGGSTGAP